MRSTVQCLLHAPYEASSATLNPQLVPTSEEQASRVESTEDGRAAPQSTENEDAVEAETDGDDFAKDPFKPFNDLGNDTGNILTVRAIGVGILCGALVNTSNIYLGLKSGWTAGANIFAYCSTHFSHIPILGRDFGPRENNIVQTAATAAGGMSNVFVSAFPAMYQLGLLDTPQRDYWRISILTALGGYFGFFFATPLRKFFICWVGRELGLIFPSSSATAITIRGMHMASEGGASAQNKTKALDLLCQWRIFWLTSKVVYDGIARSYRSLFTQSSGGQYARADRASKIKDSEVQDSALDHETVKLWMWVPGLVIVLVLTCVVMRGQFGMPVRETLLALFLAFFFSFLAIQATGATDITPLTAASKASQIILGAVTKGENWTLEQSQRMNLLGGAFASVGANQAVDLVGDFRVGYLLRTSPKLQWLAQGIGTLFAIFLAPGVYVLFSNAYPCIHDVNTEGCPFHVPSVGAWRAVAVAVTEPDFTIPNSSKNFSVFFAIFGAIMVLIRRYVLIGRWEWLRTYHPNMMVLSLAFIIDTTVVGTAMAIGAVIATIWARRSARSFEDYGYGVAAGFMAGEGIGGVVNAIIQMLGFSGNIYGTGFGCPAGDC
ncbi:MAG: hypothetical protein Q9157_001835 [Trypethelium eluteriae]